MISVLMLLTLVGNVSLIAVIASHASTHLPES